MDLMENYYEDGLPMKVLTSQVSSLPPLLSGTLLRIIATMLAVSTKSVPMDFIGLLRLLASTHTACTLTAVVMSNRRIAAFAWKAAQSVVSGKLTKFNCSFIFTISQAPGLLTGCLFLMPDRIFCISTHHKHLERI